MAAPESRRDGSEQAVTFKFVNIDVAPLTYNGQVLHTARTPSMLSMGLLILPDMSVVLVRPKISLPSTGAPLPPRRFKDMEDAVERSRNIAELWARSYSDPRTPCVLYNFTTYKPGRRWPSFLNDDGHVLEEEDYMRRAELYRGVLSVGLPVPVLDVYRDAMEQKDNKSVTKITKLLDFEAN